MGKKYRRIADQYGAAEALGVWIDEVFDEFSRGLFGAEAAYDAMMARFLAEQEGADKRLLSDAIEQLESYISKRHKFL